MSESKTVVNRLEVALEQARLLSAQFQQSQFVKSGTRHLTQVEIQQSLSIVDGPDGVRAIGKARLSVVGTIQDENKSPFFRYECEYGGVFLILDGDENVAPGAKVLPAIVDKVCGALLPLAISEAQATLSKNGLVIPGIRWSMHSLKSAQSEPAEALEAKEKGRGTGRRRRASKVR